MTELPPLLLASLEANRALPDQSLRNICDWFLTTEQLAAWARARIVADFRKQAPAPKQKPSILFV